jgi:hypothetical protein
MFRTLLVISGVLGFCVSARAELQIHDIKPRHGHLGPLRDSLKVVPGEEVVFSFYVSGVQSDAAGKVDGELVQKITSADGKELTSKLPLKDIVAFGGGRMPGYAFIAFSLKTLPGDYQLHVTVTDKLANESASFERTVTVGEPTFALIRPRLSYDPEGKIPAGLTNVVGTRLFCRMAAVGFDRSEQKIDLSMTMRLYDDAGKELMPQPMTVNYANADAGQVAKIDIVNLNAFFTCNRPGTFRASFTVTDRLTDKRATFEAPLRVVE